MQTAQGIEVVPPSSTAEQLAHKLLNLEIPEALEFVKKMDILCKKHSPLKREIPMNVFYNVLAGFRRAIDRTLLNQEEDYPWIAIPMHNAAKRRAMRLAFAEPRSYGNELQDADSLIDIAAAYHSRLEKEKSKLISEINEAVKPEVRKVVDYLCAMRITFISQMIHLMWGPLPAKGASTQTTKPAAKWTMPQKDIISVLVNKDSTNLDQPFHARDTDDHEALTYLFLIPGALIPGKSWTLKHWGLVLVTTLPKFDAKWLTWPGCNYRGPRTGAQLMRKWLDYFYLILWQIPRGLADGRAPFTTAYWINKLHTATHCLDDYDSTIAYALPSFLIGEDLTAKELEGMLHYIVTDMFAQNNTEVYRMLCKHPSIGQHMYFYTWLHMIGNLFWKRQWKDDFVSLEKRTPEMLLLIFKELGHKPAMKPLTLDKDLVRAGIPRGGEGVFRPDAEYIFYASAASIAAHQADERIARERKLWVKYYLWPQARWRAKIDRWIWAWIENHEEIQYRAEFAPDGMALLTGEAARREQLEVARMNGVNVDDTSAAAGTADKNTDDPEAARARAREQSRLIRIQEMNISFQPDSDDDSDNE